jgi:hypothetical protein
MSLETIQKEWDAIKSGIRHCNKYLNTVQDPSDDCTEIYKKLDDYDSRKQKIRETYQECDRCGKLTLLTEQCNCKH